MVEENVLHAIGDVETVQAADLDKLRRIAQVHPLRRARLCLHRSLADLTHEMIIVAHQSTYMRPHRHPTAKSESYHIIEGEMEVRIFRLDGVLERAIRMANNPGSTFMYRVTNGWWHQPVPLTEWVAYHETYTGPFDKAKDVVYAEWAPAE
jgi:cupin fold WbuC family metalloprotein